jgi:Kdo2-lipid IVA lauroyltransferase/acyltransferase
MVKARILDFLITIACWCPWRVKQLLGSAIGSVLWYADTRMAKVSLENISICYPELSASAQRQLARASLVETGRTIVETAYAWKASQDENLALIKRVENLDLVTNALNQGKGLIFVLPHLGNWEILNHYLGKHYGLTHMYQPYASPAIATLIDSYRNRTGTRFVGNDHAGIRAQLQALKNGGCVGTMPDQEPATHTGGFCDFFGTQALTSNLVSRLVDKSECAIVTVSCQRLADKPGFRIVFSATAAKNSAQLNEAIEAVIRTVPEQYLWSYKRFRTRPDGEVERYQFLQPTPMSDIASSALAMLIQASRMVPLQVTAAIAMLAARLMCWFRSADTRIAQTNIKLSFPQMTAADQQSLVRKSTQEVIRSGLELGHIWCSSDQSFDALTWSVEGLEYLASGSAIVLTPPLGNRELVMRYLGQHFHTTEYYHPNSSVAIDQQIRRQRTRMGIALAEHTLEGQQLLYCQLEQNRVVTLCPDQQPRLRGGDFVDYFGVPALTSRFLAQLVQRQQNQTGIVFGVCIREGSRFRLHFHPCQPAESADHVKVLEAINQQLEHIVCRHAEQYRWRDKRLNIRPPGSPRLYR